MKNHSPTEPVDERWVAHMRDLSTGVVPPTPADPHDMSRVAIRRTRTRRAVLVTGGGMAAVAAVAATAFALGGPTTDGVLLPGASVSVSTSADPSSGVSADVPAVWQVHELEGLTYALPPEMVTSGPFQQEPGETSEAWHREEDPDAPPFIRVAFFDQPNKWQSWPNDVSKPGTQEFELPGAELATVSDMAAEAAGLPSGSDVPDRLKGPAMLVIERADGPGVYVISLNLPHEGSKEFARQLQASLSLD
jgi:hypothetical protein